MFNYSNAYLIKNLALMRDPPQRVPLRIPSAYLLGQSREHPQPLRKYFIDTSRREELYLLHLTMIAASRQGVQAPSHPSI